MRFYQQQHRFYCGVDLHARTMYLCILDDAGQPLLHREYPAHAGAFLEAIAPYRGGLVVAVECMFAWYWLADLCAEHGIPFARPLPACRAELELGRLPPRCPESPVSDGRMNPSF